MLLFCLLFGLEFGSLGIAGSPQDTHVGGRGNVSYSLGVFLFTLFAVKKLTVLLKKKFKISCFFFLETFYEVMARRKRTWNQLH